MSTDSLTAKNYYSFQIVCCPYGLKSKVNLLQQLDIKSIHFNEKSLSCNNKITPNIGCRKHINKSITHDCCDVGDKKVIFHYCTMSELAKTDSQVLS